jgi:tetratricopeptide (TPR) repeat protein
MALLNNPKDEVAFKNRGDEYFNQGNLSQAVADYTNAIDLEPENSELYYLRAEAKIGLNEFLSAAVDYTYIISLDSTDATAYYNRGICYASLNIKVSACDDFKKAGDLGLFEAYQIIKDYCEEQEKSKVKSKK